MASVFQAFPQLRTAAPRLARRLFVCPPCTRSYASINTKSASSCVVLPARAAPARNSSSLRQPSVLQAVRWKSTQPLQAAATVSPVNSKTDAAGAKEKKWAAANPKSVAYWLLGSAASVFGIVIFGGLTRLTESGLSITEWRPVTGSLWPSSQEAWEAEFEKYKSSPEFKMLNSTMTLPEFKQIYFMEWAHRLWGRVIGITFVVPTVYLIARRKVTMSMGGKLIGICSMIAFQGFIGWWMVKSGLKDDLFNPGSHPRVSQYRLTAHLGAAFAVYCSMLLTGLGILKEHRISADPAKAAEKIHALRHPALRIFRGSVVALALLVFTTAMSGALVAGLDAGLIYNEFPWMGLGLTPPKKELLDPFYSHVPDQSDLLWRNMLENPSFVQLDHRILATTTFTAVLSLFAYTRFSGAVRSRLPPDAKKGVLGLVHLVSLQVTLGFFTLIYMVPTWLASAHQAGALALLTGATVLYSRISMPRAAVLRALLQKYPHPPKAPTQSIRSRIQTPKS
ncbi:electron transfer protein 1, mitochondrial precursor [Periconia macrospinosa]|uniref:Electron transfer protein 1, mitochondrial n=1 Tax=Periconia macrospinosa TaxID=97972 RepID=A0A2V1E8J9_9PLEO|nr:electron transfer protein 1, mitochondrial precursor [Periconia macrospinosa]